MDKKEDIKYVLDKDMERFDDYIERADNKANFLLTISGALIIAIFFQGNELITKLESSEIKFIMFIIIAITIFFLAKTIYFSLQVIIPRTSNKNEESLFYFESVKKYETGNLSKKIKLCSEEDIFTDLSKQVSQLAKICSSKMNNVKKASNSLVISIFAIVSLVVIYLLNNFWTLINLYKYNF
ncbi:Pycsar system effector family protein [Clostridium perfringens]|uniref:Pycsar system effector family protein n=2 Tax=Clostridium perfringens TaxID=1502 RepID=UPI000705E412|nr:Pycsar system effector family protein [Clostridium perfringens]ALG47754.1 Phage protein [Clostridium perfringens]EHK2388416.1 hypothetical protein [Clostridium perfringens]EHK2403128.1 hypothetical protein [Clostridium perfringens]EJT5933762.1 hypothetical protein [Clostridium perfringens]ELC8436783.1 hypothetical protein [Clostridium perfringens]